MHERLYVYFKPSADDAAAWRTPWLEAAQQLARDAPGLHLECLQRADAGAVTWMEVYGGLPLPQLRLASQTMAQALSALKAQRHHEVFSPVGAFAAGASPASRWTSASK